MPEEISGEIYQSHLKTCQGKEANENLFMGGNVKYKEEIKS